MCVHTCVNEVDECWDSDEAGEKLPCLWILNLEPGQGSDSSSATGWGCVDSNQVVCPLTEDPALLVTCAGTE